MKTNNTLIRFAVFVFILSTISIFAQPLPNNYGINFEREQTAVVVGQNGLIMRTEDAGSSWTTQNSGVTEDLFSVASVIEGSPESQITIQMVTGKAGKVLKSTDLGVTWTEKEAGVSADLNNILLVNANVYLACGTNGTIIRSTDKGETWKTLTSGISSNINSLSYNNPITASIAEARLIAVGDNGSILILQEYGNVCVEQISNVTENLNYVYFVSQNIVFACGDNGIIIKSTDAGNTWEPITTGITQNIFDLKFLNENTGIAVCEDGYILITHDGGATWAHSEAGITADLFSLNYFNLNLILIAGENSTELYSTDCGETWLNKESDYILGALKQNENIQLSQNYPNPFNPSTSINYVIPSASYVTLKVYDMLGKEVKTLTDEFQNAGTHRVTFDATNLSSGIYFYTIRSSGNIKTMKMILTK